MEQCNNCPLRAYCLTQKSEWENCNDMVLRYNAGLLLPPELVHDFGSINEDVRSRMSAMGLSVRVLADKFEMSEQTFLNKLNQRNNQKFTACERYCLAAILHLKLRQVK